MTTTRTGSNAGFDLPSASAPATRPDAASAWSAPSAAPYTGVAVDPLERPTEKFEADPAELALAALKSDSRGAQASIGAMTTGAAYPLGAHWDGHGVNFALVAPSAEAVELCLFEAEGPKELRRIALAACTDGVWHGYLAGAMPGLTYGYRVYGRYAPDAGHRFNPSKLLLDPYARAIVGRYLGQSEFRGDNQIDTAAIALKARVLHEDYDWGNDRPPRVPPAATILYELHVKGYTQTHPGVPEALRGSYAALAQPAVLDHLSRLGVTSVSLLPVHHRADEARLQQHGLSNYWGYSSIGFFAPEARYWSGRPGSTPTSEFRDMVKALHQRGIEVILDVVYNHTGETDELGPTLSFRGIDNALYYRLQADNPALYENWSGCGNCLNLSEPRVLQLVMDSLRYWVQDMHVDGFRFDLAPILGRDEPGFSARAGFFAALRQDPVLAGVKLIAEPWDVGPGGYQLGNFPAGWLEWNDQYRDTMRSFWLHQWPSLGEFAQRFAASSQTFRRANRQPAASVNFITAHDGFTLQDLVSYNHRHNEPNLEDNRDGHHHNHSWNCGVEGPTDSEDIRQLRMRLKRALLTSLLLSQGTPMLLAGDEIGQSQGGNNNAYCQDNASSWLDWSKADTALTDYVVRLIGLRRRFGALSNNRWYDELRSGHELSQPASAAISLGTSPDARTGAQIAGPTGELTQDARFDIDWLTPEGEAMTGPAWDCKSCYRIGIRLTERGGRQTCLLLINAEARASDFVLPSGVWDLLLDSSAPQDPAAQAHGRLEIPAHAILFLEKTGEVAGASAGAGLSQFFSDVD